MELRDQEGEGFVVVSKVNNVYPIELKVKSPGLAAWMDIGCSKMSYTILQYFVTGIPNDISVCYSNLSPISLQVVINPRTALF